MRLGIGLRQTAAIIGLAALLTIGTRAGCVPGEDSPAKTYGPIPWTASVPNARKVAKQQKKPILIDFYAEWCGPCKEMLRTTYKDSKVVARAKQFVPVLVNVDKQPELAKKYGVQLLPTVVFTDAKGAVLRKQEGYDSADDFLALTDGVLKQVVAAKK